jgi:hypothetical protein
VARASSEQELRELLRSDPYQQQGLAEYEIFAFEATEFPKRSSGFEAFASSPLREGHAFWKEEPGPEYEKQLLQFLKNLGLIGGLLMVLTEKET